jgi:hypothetical protein
VIPVFMYHVVMREGVRVAGLNSWNLNQTLLSVEGTAGREHGNYHGKKHFDALVIAILELLSRLGWEKGWGGWMVPR